MRTTALITCAFAIVWIERPVRSPVADLLADLGEARAAVHAPWYPFGAQAANLVIMKTLAGRPKDREGLVPLLEEAVRKVRTRNG